MERPKGLPVVQYVRDSRFHAHGMAYRFLDEDRTHWLAGPHVIQAWVDSIDWANTVLVAHNIRFDGSILRWRFNATPAYAHVDTVGLAKAILGENVSSYSLGRLAEYLGLPAKGDLSCDGIRNPVPEQLATLGEYCKNDVDICRGIYEKLMPQFPQGQLFSLDWTIRCFIEPRLNLNGAVLSGGVIKERNRREEVIRASRVSKDVLSSNKQFAQLLVERGIPVRTKVSGRTGKAIPAFAKTDDGLEDIKKLAPALYAGRIASKANLLETRGEALLGVSKTGAFPFDVGFSGAVQTHRYSGGSGAGGNPQNFTRGSFLRAAVEAPPGFGLVVGDFAAIEARLVAWLAKEPKLMNEFAKDADVYCAFASLLFGRPITKKDLLERMLGKVCILGLGYGMGGDKFLKTVNLALRTFIEDCKRKGIDTSGMKDSITLDEAKKIVKLYRGAYFNIPNLWSKANDILPLLADGKIGCLWFAPFIRARKNALILPSGLTIQYPNLRFGYYFDRKSNEEREGWHYDAYFKTYEAEPVGIYGGMVIENICQALAGELCKAAIERAEQADIDLYRQIDTANFQARIMENIQRKGLPCVGQIHDEIIAICPRGQEDRAVKLLTQVMETAPPWLPNIKLKSEVGYGSNWQNAKK